MKKAVAVLLTCVTMLGLTACGKASKEGWTDADLDFKPQALTEAPATRPAPKLPRH